MAIMQFARSEKKRLLYEGLTVIRKVLFLREKAAQSPLPAAASHPQSSAVSKTSPMPTITSARKSRRLFLYR
jgi:hypothetical protein